MTDADDNICDCCNSIQDYLIATMIVFDLVLVVCESCNDKLPDMDMYAEYVVLADEL